MVDGLLHALLDAQQIAPILLPAFLRVHEPVLKNEREACQGTAKQYAGMKSGPWLCKQQGVQSTKVLCRIMTGPGESCVP